MVTHYLITQILSSGAKKGTCLELAVEIKSSGRKVFAPGLGS